MKSLRPWVGMTLLAYATAVHANEPSNFEVQAAEAAAAAALPDTLNRAKNIILFVGDGMGVTTVTAARILDGQNQGNTGEENSLFFERFPFTALSKTYAINQQTPDSASTMTAMVTGHKTKGYVISYDADVILNDHTSTQPFGGASRPVETLVEQFEKEGRATGIVTTTRLTHATPACCYAHSASRNWEDHYYDEEKTAHLPLIKALKAGFKDIALQLVEFPYGDGIDVALGGGRRGFLPSPPPDQEADALKWGRRLDNRNLVQEWNRREGGAYVENRQQLLELEVSGETKLLGLFHEADLTFEIEMMDEETRSQPTLAEMATTALSVVEKNENGFFLMVEGGRIDHGHHLSSAARALTETLEFDRAVRAVYEALSEDQRAETLIIVTADHSHTFTIAGYPTRGNPILGKVIANDSQGQPESQAKLDALGLPYTTVSYANGPGSTAMVIDKETLSLSPGGHHDDHAKDILDGKLKYFRVPVDPRPNLTPHDTTDPHYIQEGRVPMAAETHGGEDVAIYATGPGAHLFRGTREQNYIYHAIQVALKGF